MEKIKIKNILALDFFGNALFTSMCDGEANVVEKFNINSGDQDVNVELKINGVVVSLSPFIKKLEEYFDEQVNKAAEDKLKNEFSKLKDVLEEAKQILHNKFREAGLVSKED